MRSAIALFAYRFLGICQVWQPYLRLRSHLRQLQRQIHHKPTQNLRARQDPVQVLMERNRQIHLLPGTCDQERDPTGNFVCIGLLQFEVSSPDKSCNCWRSLANVWLLQSLGSSHVKVCLQERRSYEAAPRSFCKVALTSCNPTEQRPKKTKTLNIDTAQRFGCLEANSIESYLVVPCWFFDLPGSVWLELVISIEPLPRKEVRTKCNQTVRRQGLGSSDCPLTGLARKARRYPKKQTGITGRQLIRETVKRLGIPWVSFQVLKSPNPHSKVLKSHPSGDTGWKNSSLWPDKNRADLGIWDFSGNSFAGFNHFHDRSILHLQDKSWNTKDFATDAEKVSKPCWCHNRTLTISPLRPLRPPRTHRDSFSVFESMTTKSQCLWAYWQRGQRKDKVLQHLKSSHEQLRRHRGPKLALKGAF